MKGPSFKIPINILVAKFQNYEKFSLCSIDSIQDISDADLETITAICNQDLIYSILFKERLKGSPYLLADGQKFITWSKEGWSKNEWFVFLIRNSQNKIVGAVDIKSNNLENAEVGYWMSNKVPGVMTNAIIALCNLAKEAGYKSLYGLTVLGNIKSQNVLTRAGFKNVGEVQQKGKQYIKFLKEL